MKWAIEFIIKILTFLDALLIKIKLLFSSLPHFHDLPIAKILAYRNMHFALRDIFWGICIFVTVWYIEWMCGNSKLLNVFNLKYNWFKIINSNVFFTYIIKS